MIDPGRPFSEAHSYVDLIQSLEEQIRSGVQQVDQQRFIFKKSESSYALSRTIEAITRVTGMVTGNGTVFEAGVDFEFRNNRIIWQVNASQFPDEGTWFQVLYTYRDRPTGLNDFSPGSVTGTLVRTIALQLKLLYEQMDEAYRRGFIDTASGTALDNVVAVLGITRNLAKSARGAVSFTRKDIRRSVTIRKNTKLATESGITFITTEEVTIAAGDTGSQVRIPIMAEQPGIKGNVPANTIVIMPTPPSGLGSATVTNPEVLQEGQEQELDEQLRERAKFRLERSGNATLNAIKFAILEKVDGVQGVQVMDYSTDPAIPLGEVRVSYSGNANLNRVQEIINETRAAGILAQVSRITTLLISGRFYVISDGSSAEGGGLFRQKVIDALKELAIAEPLSLRRLNALAYGIPGLAEVAEAQLMHNRSIPPVAVTDPFLTQAMEQLRPDEQNLQVIVLNAMTLTAARNNKTIRLTLQVGRQKTTPPLFEPGNFKTWAIAVNVMLKAKLRTQPDDPAETVAVLTPMATFTNAATATVVINDADFLANATRPTGYRPADHDPNNVEVMLSVPAYSGLGTAKTTVTLNPPP
ncbi:MAG: baseplate J/gp47 family protein [Synechococcales bacterium]|nr:baseplate J/gp47 family protein [Synechococcales bacterium]